jgi:phosphoglycerol transferase MdoB-like AlkP superfamily enzyme
MKLSFNDSFELSISLLKKILLAQFLFLLLMSIFRVLFYLEFSANEKYILSEIISAYIMGVRLDLVILGYVQALISILFFIVYFLRSHKIYMFIKKILPTYLLVFYLIITGIIATDFGYFSFFNEHITLMIYGIMDDDTMALLRTVYDNYNIVLIFFIAIFYMFLLKALLRNLFFKDIYPMTTRIKISSQIYIFIIIILINALAIRGSLGMYPLSKIIPDVSTNKFVNELSNNGVIAFIKATKLYKKSRSGKYDLIKSTKFEGKMNQAFSILTQKNISKNDNLIESITYKTNKNETLELLKPHVVVVMVESFGLPITKYQSETFDILGKLQKHFKEDTLFTNFISTSNGTIVSLEPLLLNITARPNSTSLGQSKYQYTSFTQAVAKVYKNAGYETNFIYGGNLNWRNVGKFMSFQGFDNQNGKIDIIKSLNKDEKKSSHDWGVFDQYSYDYVIKLLKEAKKPQFIFLLTTNNHPPFKTPQKYKHNSLVAPQDLNERMVGDKELIQKRLLDYQYALDMAGVFMDKVKNSKLKDNTVVAITADNNTIEGRIRYENQLSTSKKIPFYLYMPESIKVQDIDTKVAGSHKDIFPTLYNQTLSNSTYICVGKNLLDKNTRHCGFNDKGIIISDAGAFYHNKFTNNMQTECNKEYDSALAISDWLIRIYSNVVK